MAYGLARTDIKSKYVCGTVIQFLKVFIEVQSFPHMRLLVLAKSVNPLHQLEVGLAKSRERIGLGGL